MNNLTKSNNFSWGNSEFLNEQRSEMFEQNKLSHANEAIKNTINFDIKVGHLSTPITASVFPSTTFANVKPKAPVLVQSIYKIDNQRQMILNEHVREGVSGLVRHDGNDHKVSVELLKKAAVKLLNTKVKQLNGKIIKDFPVQDSLGQSRVVRVGGYKQSSTDVLITFAYFVKKDNIDPATLAKPPILVKRLYN